VRRETVKDFGDRYAKWATKSGDQIRTANPRAVMRVSKLAHHKEVSHT